MSSVVVVDSGVFLTSILLEPLEAVAESFLEYLDENSIQLVAPSLLQYEFVSVLRKSVVQKRISPNRALISRDFLLNYPIEYHMDTQLLKRAYDLATLYQRPATYDAQYLAVAEKLGCDFWTADERLYNALKSSLSWIKWLGNFAPPTP